MLSTTSLLPKWKLFLEFCVYHSTVYKNNLTIPLHNWHIVLFCFIELYTNIRLYIIFWGLLFFTPHYVSKCHMLLCLAVVFFFFCCIIFFCENKLSGIVSVFLLQTVLFWIFFYLSPVVMLRNYESSYILKWNCWAMRSSKIYLYKIMPNSFPKLLMHCISSAVLKCSYWFISS